MAAATATPPKTAKAAVAKSPGASLALNSIADLQSLAGILYRGGLTPPGIDSEQKVAAVILAGLEVGLAPTQALGSIMLTNGKLSIYGDGALALVRASGLLETIAEVVEGEGAARTGKCVVKRKGELEKLFTFSMAQADKAGLIERAKGKGPWASYPDRMLIMRARGFALRDVFPDVLRGLITFEEAQDGSVIETEVKVVSVSGVPVEPPAPATPVATAPVVPAVAPQLPAAPIATAASVTAPAVQDGPVTDEQKGRFLELKKLVCASSGAHTLEDQRAAWTNALAPFGVKSVAELTRVRADAVLAELGKTHDPFSQPDTPTGSLI